jgi:hypothetical protein
MGAKGSTAASASKPVPMTATPMSRATVTPDDIDKMMTPASQMFHADSRTVMDIGVQNSEKTLSLMTIPDTWVNWKTGKEEPLTVLYINTDQRQGVIDFKRRPNWTVIDLPIDLVNPQLTVDRMEAIVRGLTDGRWKFTAIVLDSTTPFSWNVKEAVWLALGGVEDSDVYAGNELRYKALTSTFMRLMFGLKNNCFFFFVIGHEAPPFWADEGKKDAVYTIDMPGGIKKLLPKLWEEIYFSYQYGGKWMWLTQTAFKREPRTCYPIQKFIPKDYSIIINRRWDEFRRVDEPVIPATETIIPTIEEAKNEVD